METRRNSKRLCLQSLAAVLAVLQFSGCATIVSGRHQKVDFQSNPSGATVTVNGAERGVTPLSLKLRRKDTHVVKIVKEGYIEETRMTKQGYNWWDLGSALLLGVIGIAIDLVSGAAYKITPDHINVELIPKPTS